MHRAATARQCAELVTSLIPPLRSEHPDLQRLHCPARMAAPSAKDDHALEKHARSLRFITSGQRLRVLKTVQVEARAHAVLLASRDVQAQLKMQPSLRRSHSRHVSAPMHRRQVTGRRSVTCDLCAGLYSSPALLQRSHATREMRPTAACIHIMPLGAVAARAFGRVPRFQQQRAHSGSQGLAPSTASQSRGAAPSQNLLQQECRSLQHACAQVRSAMRHACAARAPPHTAHCAARSLPPRSRAASVSGPAVLALGHVPVRPGCYRSAGVGCGALLGHTRCAPTLQTVAQPAAISLFAALPQHCAPALADCSRRAPCCESLTLLSTARKLRSAHCSWRILSKGTSAGRTHRRP